MKTQSIKMPIIRKTLTALCFLMVVGNAWGDNTPVVFFNETFGTSLANVTNIIASNYTGWSEQGCSHSGNAKVGESSSDQCSLTGSSGGVYLYESTDNIKSFTITGINTLGFSNITISANYKKSNSSGTFSLAYRNAGSEIAYLATPTTSYTGWGTYTSTTIPSSSNLSITIERTSTGTIYFDDLKLIGTPITETLNLSATNGTNYYATFSCDHAVEFTDNTTTVYTASVVGSSLVLTEVANKQVPANTGVLIKSSTNTANYTTIVSATALEGNLLVPGTGAEFTEGGKYYKLSYGDAQLTPSTLGFYWGADNGAAFTGTVGKAYLHTPSDFSFGSSAAPAHFTFDEEEQTATGTDKVNATAKAQKYIENGQVRIVRNGLVYNALGQIVR